MLKRRKEGGTYLATDSRHRWRVQMTMKKEIKCSFQPALRPSSAVEEESSSTADEGRRAG